MCIRDRVYLTGGQTDTTQTDINGRYTFDQVAMGNNYTVQPLFQVDSCTDDCINSLDKILMDNHILGITPFSSPYQYIAADVNQSGSITAFDGVQIRQLYSGINSSYANSPCWRFIDSDYTFTTTNPAAENFNEAIDITNLSNDVQADFVGVQIGNISGCCDSIETSFLEITVNSLNIDCNTTSVSIPVSVKKFDAVSGFQFSLNWNPLNLQFDGTSNYYNLVDLNAGSFHQNGGELAVFWSNSVTFGQTVPDGTVLFNLDFTVLNPVNTSVFFDNTPTSPLVVTQSLATSLPITQDGLITVDTTTCPPPMDSCVILTIMSDAVCQGEQVCVDVTVENFVEIASMQASMNFDHNSLQFQQFQGFNLTDLTASNFNASNATSGGLSFSWFDNTANGITLPNNTVIFQICFIALQDGVTNVNFSNSPSVIEIANTNQSECFNTNNGLVTIDTAMCPPPIDSCVNLTIIPDTVCQGEQVCVAVTVQNFTDIISMQSSLNFDHNSLQFQQFQGFNLTDLTASNFNGSNAASGGLAFSMV